MRAWLLAAAVTWGLVASVGLLVDIAPAQRRVLEHKASFRAGPELCESYYRWEEAAKDSVPEMRRICEGRAALAAADK